MKIGYGVFGVAYEKMLKNDLHNINSIDHKLIKNMILLDNNSTEFLYSQACSYDVKNHELYHFAQKFKALNDKETIQNLL